MKNLLFYDCATVAQRLPKGNRLLVTLLVLLCISIGNAWGVDTNTPTSGKYYRFKATVSSTTYYLVAPTTSGIGNVTTTSTDGTVFLFTKESNNWYITFISGGTTYYMYESGSNGQVSISTSKTKVSIVTTDGDYAKIGGSKWIQFNGSANPKRMGCYSSSQTKVKLELVPSYTLKVANGTGGYTTYTSKLQSDLTQTTAEGGNNCSDGLAGNYSGWRTTSLETPAASPGTTYNHASATPPSDGSTLYALFRQKSGSYYYLTNPLCEASACDKSVTINQGAATNCSLSFSTGASGSKLETCSSTAADRQVTITVTPNTCYAAPVAGSVTSTGTACTITGPSGSGPYTYVAQFAQNATSSTSFSCALSTKTTYTVTYNKGNASGATGESSSGTKTCGTALVLPNTAMFTRTGYTQTGWSTAQAGTSKNYNLGGSYTTDAATTLYPYWQANVYTVTWKVNNTPYSAGGSTEVTHGNHVATLPTAPNPASYCGQKFVGWTTQADYSGNSAPSPLYKTASEFPAATENQIFYAVFADYVTP